MSSDYSVQFQVHQNPPHSSPSSLQNVAINLGPGAPSSFSIGSGIYSEVGPPLVDSRCAEMQRERPPVPPRLLTSSAMQENLYDIPECDTRSMGSHTYTLPADARDDTHESLAIDNLIVMPRPNNSADRHHGGCDTGDTWFGRRSPLLVFQQAPQAGCSDDILEVLPFAVRSDSFSSQQSCTTTRSDNSDAGSDEESCMSVRSTSPTHEMVDAFLPRTHQSESPEDCSVSPQFPLDYRQVASAFTEDAGDMVDFRPSYNNPPVCHTDSFPPVRPLCTHTDRKLVSGTGNSSPAPSSSSGCTDLSKYSGDYERDPLYMEVLRQKAAMVTTNSKDSELSSGVDCTYSPLSPIPPMVEARENCYTPLNCHKIEPSPAYAQLQRHILESTV